MKMNWLKFLIAGLVVTVGVMVCNGVTLDNDSWYVLAEGRGIVENGIYFEDQLSMHEGLDVTVQNYGFAAVFYLLYAALGPVGIYIILLILNLILLFLIYKVCKVISKGNVNLSLILAVFADLLLARWFVVTRAQMVSFIIIMLLIYLLELYIESGKTKYLWWLPVMSLFQINLHASMWPMMLIVISVYIVDSLGFKKLHLDKYKTWPLIVALVGMILVGFLNPYGYKMMTLMLTSYGVAEAGEFINELKPFAPLGDASGAVLYLAIAAVMVLCIFGRKQKIKMRWLILMLGFLALGLNSFRGMAYLILMLPLPLAAMYGDFKVKAKYRKICWMEASWAGIIGLVGVVAMAVIRFPAMTNGPSETLIAAVDFLDAETALENKDELKIYTGFDHGGFLEYRGYKTYMDPRMEVFLKSNNGKEDLFLEFYKLERGRIEKADFLKKYDFDYLVTVDGENMNKLKSDRYEVIYESEEVNDEDEPLVMVWKKL